MATDEPPKGKKASLQKEYEWAFMAEKRARFDAAKCPAWARLTAKFGPKISQEELLSLAQVISHELRLGLSREYKRRKELLVKWYDENLDVIWPFIETRVVISDREGRQIDMTKPGQTEH
jgi:hypothetical protein